MRTDEQFVDFVTTYFKQYGDEGEYDSLNQCRINTNVSSNMNYSFQTQFRHKNITKPKQCGLNLLKPHSTKTYTQIINYGQWISKI